MSRSKKRPVPVSELETNMRAIRIVAVLEQAREGRIWYPLSGRIVADIMRVAADLTGDYSLTFEQACEIVAAMSQNTGWADNLNRFRRYVRGEMANGRGHLRRVMAELSLIEEHGTADLGIKRNAFKRNLAGDLTVHTSDRWALRAAFKLDAYDPNRPETFPQHVSRARTKDRRTGAVGPWYCEVNLTEEVQAKMQAAAETVAAEFGESVAQTQAIVWCVIRGDAN